MADSCNQVFIRPLFTTPLLSARKRLCSFPKKKNALWVEIFVPMSWDSLSGSLSIWTPPRWYHQMSWNMWCHGTSQCFPHVNALFEGFGRFDEKCVSKEALLAYELHYVPLTVSISSGSHSNIITQSKPSSCASTPNLKIHYRAGRLRSGVARMEKLSEQRMTGRDLLCNSTLVFCLASWKWKQALYSYKK